MTFAKEIKRLDYIKLKYEDWQNIVSVMDSVELDVDETNTFVKVKNVLSLMEARRKLELEGKIRPKDRRSSTNPGLVRS